MKSKVLEFMDHLTHAVATQDLDGLCLLFKPPLPVYFEEKLVIKATSEDVWKAGGNLLQGVRKSGATRVTYDVLDVSEVPKTGAVAVKVVLMFRDDGDQICGQSRLRYVLEPHDKLYLVTLVDYYQVAFPSVFDA